jgi:CheY-like chemotaxis protein
MVQDGFDAERAAEGVRKAWSRLAPHAAVELSFPALAIAGLALTVAPHVHGLTLFATVTVILAIAANAAFSLVRAAACGDRLDEASAAVARGVDAIDTAAAAVHAALRARPAVPEAVPQPAPEPVEGPAFEPARPLRVLVAEANGAHQLMLRTLLGQVGVEPEVTADGAALLEAWRREPWDLILIDMQAPDLDGATLAAMIRTAEVKAGWPLTASVALGAAGEGAYGVDAAVAKPIVGAALIQAIETALAEPAADSGSTAHADVA